jgi:hypothetical protein
MVGEQQLMFADSFVDPVCEVDYPYSLELSA